jgi:hemerythrin-like domain-containing protein
MKTRRDALVGDAGRRRDVIVAGAAFGLGLFARSAAAADKDKSSEKRGSQPDKKDEKEEDIGPGEDLMREHGVLRRVLLVYGELGRRLEAGPLGDAQTGALVKAARLVRRFVEDYHERQEEEMVFPRFERAGRLAGLVGILRAQHQAGRKVTEQVQGLANVKALADANHRQQLRAALHAFTRMYEPHAAREDTVLFPALHDIVSKSEYDALGEDFERREHKVFGEDGFEHAVAEVDDLEKTLGIEDLAAFTP